MEKPKKERTEAQKNATLRMLKAKREKKEQKPESESESEKEVIEKKPRAKKEKVIEGKILAIDVPVSVVAPKVPEKATYLTKEDFHAFRNDIMAAITPAIPVVQEKKVFKKERKERVYEDEEEEKPRAPVKAPVKAPAPSKPLSGYDLLDALLRR